VKTPNFSHSASATSLVSKVGGQIHGVLSGFDRLRFRGTLPQLYQPTVMEAYLSSQHVLLKHFGQYVEKVSQTVRAASKAFAEKWGRPWRFLNSSAQSKEELARKIAGEDGVEEGLIAVFSAVEPCQSYDLTKNPQTGHLELQRELRKCRHDYFYFEDEQFGFLHVRLQTWFPFQINVCLNGRHWLARQLAAEQIGYLKRENAVVWVADLGRAQELLARQVLWPWSQALEALKDLVHPEGAGICQPLGLRYVWTVAESEYATDLLFKNPADLAQLYPALVQHAVSSFGAADVMRFLGRKVPASGHVNGHFQGEVISDLKHRPEGIRVKHSVDGNTLKMYDKQGSVLRVETTINRPDEFSVWRPATNHPVGPCRWRRLRRSVEDMPRRAEVSAKANERYLEQLGSVSGKVTLAEQLEDVCQPVRKKGHRARALNPLSQEDAALLAVVHRGEFALNGFRNAEVRTLLYPAHPLSKKTERRLAARTRRRILLLRYHGLVHKQGRSRRYVVTPKGQAIMTAVLTARQVDVDQLTKLAA
jgi:hypothetical protein